MKPVKPDDLLRKYDGLLFYKKLFGFTGFTRLPCGFKRFSARFHWFHTPGVASSMCYKTGATYKPVTFIEGSLIRKGENHAATVNFESST